MTRIAGIELQDKDTICYSLTQIKGIGMPLSLNILTSLGIDKGKRVKDLKVDELSKITAKIEEYPIEGDLLRLVRGNITRLQQIGSYRGIRHSRGLPARGQRTRHNARTKRGKRKTVGAFKKELLSRSQTQKEEKGKAPESK
jgi:small subunit ribosomal protein S13